MRHISERELELPKTEIGHLLEVAVEHKEIVSLGPGEPDFPPAPEIVSETKKIAHLANHYAPPIGLRALREAVSRKVRESNKIKADLENVIITTGSQEALLLAMMSCTDATEQVIVPDPGFLGYVPCIELVDAVPMPLRIREENNFHPDADELEKLVTSKTSAIILNTPGNPTGSVFPKKVLEEIADVAIDKDLYIISDEAYEDIVYDKSKHVSIGSLEGMHEHVISMFTFSKSYAMCGYRVGYCVAPKNIITAMAKSKIYTTLSTPTISQLLALRALGMKKAYTMKMVNEYKRRRNMLVKRLNSMNFATKMPQGAFYTFSNIKEFDKDDRRFAKALLNKAKVAMVPGSDFGTYGTGYLRCSYATDYKKIEEAMNRVEGFLRKY